MRRDDLGVGELACEVLDDRPDPIGCGVPDWSGLHAVDASGRCDMEGVGPRTDDPFADHRLDERLERLMLCGEVRGADVDDVTVAGRA